MRPDEHTRPGVPIVSPSNMIPVQVVRRQEVAPDVVSILVVLPGTRQAPSPYLPGQFVTLALPTPRETLYRSYSLCGDGDAGQPWELTIKRMHLGAVSTYFYESVAEGTLLYSSLPRGAFTLPALLSDEMSIVMVATGSGITPIMGMLRSIAGLHPEERPLVHLHYASKAPEEIIFGEELYALDPDNIWLRQRHYLSSQGARMSVDAILSRSGSVALKSHWYLCGADSLKRELQARLISLGTPERHIHSEVFASQVGPAYRITHQRGVAADASLRIVETGAALDVQANETLLTALERHGYRPDFSCRVGACGACKLRVVEGQVDPIGEALSASERAQGYVLSCIARPIGEVSLASGGHPPVGAGRGRAGVGAPSRGGAITLTRLASLVGVGALLVGSWQLTNHRPASWAHAAPAATQQPTDDATSTETPTPLTLPGGGPAPTHVAGSKNTPAPGQPTPTLAPAPKPTPKATSTPSPRK